MEIKINKEIRAYRETLFFGLSVRQFVCSVLAVGIAVVCAGIVAAVLISRQLQNTQAQTQKQKDEKSAYHRKKGGK